MYFLFLSVCQEIKDLSVDRILHTVATIKLIIQKKDDFENGFIITWILHQIIMYSNKVKLVAG